MSENVVIDLTNRFCKSGGDLHHLSRDFHKLDRVGKEYAVELIQQGETPEKALKLAKIKQQKLF